MISIFKKKIELDTEKEILIKGYKSKVREIGEKLTYGEFTFNVYDKDFPLGASIKHLDYYIEELKSISARVKEIKSSEGKE